MRCLTETSDMGKATCTLLCTFLVECFSGSARSHLPSSKAIILGAISKCCSHVNRSASPCAFPSHPSSRFGGRVCVKEIGKVMCTFCTPCPWSNAFLLPTRWMEGLGVRRLRAVISGRGRIFSPRILVQNLNVLITSSEGYISKQSRRSIALRLPACGLGLVSSAFARRQAPKFKYSAHKLNVRDFVWPVLDQ